MSDPVLKKKKASKLARVERPAPGTELLPPAPEGVGHTWRIYDPNHRACERCGLRLFYTTVGAVGFGRGSGWLMLDFAGRPSLPMLGGRNGLAECTPPAAGEPVFIAYSGNPEIWPGCERVMHRHPEGAALLDLGALVPSCGLRCAFWELGPARHSLGWTWCQDCYPGRNPPHIKVAPPSRIPDPPPRLLEQRPAAALKPKKKPKAKAPKLGPG